MWTQDSAFYSGLGTTAMFMLCQTLLCLRCKHHFKIRQRGDLQDSEHIIQQIWGFLSSWERYIPHNLRGKKLYRFNWLENKFMISTGKTFLVVQRYREVHIPHSVIVLVLRYIPLNQISIPLENVKKKKSEIFIKISFQSYSNLLD